MIRVNDKWDVPAPEGLTVRDVLTTCGFTHRHIVVSINGILVAPGTYDEHLVHDGDSVLVVHIIGGG